jgi:hypothetical protein
MKPKRFVPAMTQIEYNPGDLVEVIAGWGEYSLIPSTKGWVFGPCNQGWIYQNPYVRRGCF